MGVLNHYKGIIAEVRLYNKALKPDEILQVPLWETNSSLVGYWRPVDVRQKVIKDITKSHNDGTFGNDKHEELDGPKIMDIPISTVNNETIDWITSVVIKKKISPP